MKKLILFISLLILVASTKSYAQNEKKVEQEKFGNTLNLGLGLGYYGYVPGAIPAFNINYEFDIARVFTLAPFVNAYTYRNYYYWGDNNNNYREYSYQRTVVPVGAKATYYFDELLSSGHKWDFYAAGSVGFVFVSTTYEEGYGGDRGTYNGVSPFYIDAHLGSEFHITNTFGVYLDLSTGLSTFGLAVHL
ncbi:MAG: hypothetical protein H7282_02370 [Cytophagaceae bacterium]|nr:hypothetical protein [Cytophagaceae bacterium]